MTIQAQFVRDTSIWLSRSGYKRTIKFVFDPRSGFTCYLESEPEGFPFKTIRSKGTNRGIMESFDIAIMELRGKEELPGVQI